MHPATTQYDGLRRRSRLALSVAFILAGNAYGAAAREPAVPCLEVTAPTGERPIVWNGHFDVIKGRAREEIAVCVHLSSPRTLRITIDGSGLSTVGHVRFPDGHEEGAPGGPFFDEGVDAGDYGITVRQRWPKRKAGTIRIELEVK
jgi:hypothetical protein